MYWRCKFYQWRIKGHLHAQIQCFCGVDAYFYSPTTGYWMSLSPFPLHCILWLFFLFFHSFHFGLVLALCVASHILNFKQLSHWIHYAFWALNMKVLWQRIVNLAWKINAHCQTCWVDLFRSLFPVIRRQQLYQVEYILAISSFQFCIMNEVLPYLVYWYFTTLTLRPIRIQCCQFQCHVVEWLTCHPVWFHFIQYLTSLIFSFLSSSAYWWTLVI